LILKMLHAIPASGVIFAMIHSGFHKAPTGLAAVAIMFLGSVTTAPAQTSLQVKIAARPLTRGDLTAYKLPSTTQFSAGLNNVAIGEPLYLEAQLDAGIPAANITGVTWELTLKPLTSKATLTDSPLGKDMPVYERADRLVSQVAGRTLLKPDVTGEYVVSATVSTTSAGTARVSQTFFGATYVGIAGCTRCHSGGMAQNMAVSWSKTAHATLFTEGVNGVASDHYSASCVACHTVGYDTTAGAVNGGFDDIAAQLKWVFPTTQKPGVFEAMPDALKNVANIQCENCHGPGSLHTASPSPMSISKSMGSADCAQCHDAPTHHIKNGEWNNSRHAVVTRDPSGAGREGCVGCHTGSGFVQKAKGAAITNTVYDAITCQACHESHGQTAPSSNAHLVRMESVKLADGTEVTDGGAGKLCMNCHQSRQNAAVYAATAAASARFGPHHGPQADMIEGVNGFTYGKSIPSSAHSQVVADTCVTCHMPTVAETDPSLTHAGGHTFNMSWVDSTNKQVDLVTGCQQCHGKMVAKFDFRLMDYNDDGVIEGVQTEVQHLLDEVSALLPPVGKPKTALTIDTTWTRAQLEAAYNWQFVAEDKSLGVHNTAYTVGLLKASIADLTKK
jgi:hypothetical protein